MPLPYRILIELDLEFDTRSGQDLPPLPRPGEIISAGFTEFKEHIVRPDKYLIIEAERGQYTRRTLRSQDQETFDYWNGADFITVTQSEEEIKTRKEKARKDAREIENGENLEDMIRRIALEVHNQAG